MKASGLMALGCLLLFGNALARADSLSYTCDPSVSAAVCTVLNTTISGLYTSTFSNLNANIYIEYGATGLSQSTTGFDNQIPYATYVSDLAAEDGPGIVRADAIASLSITEPALYDGAPIDISSALGAALGISGLAGTTANGNYCIVGTTGCYNGIITVTNDPSTSLYYRFGTIDADAFDFFSLAEHETDEVLGTASCIDTTGPGNTLVNNCPNNTAAAVDLYRYNAGSRVLVDSTVGAYFSYDGGATNGAGGALYNTLPNGEDYADFISGCPGDPRVQDASGCPGFAGLDITNDGGAEINILDALGYNLNQPNSVTPEPSPRALVGLGLALLAFFRFRPRKSAVLT